MDAALRGVCFVQGALQIYIMSLARSELSIKMQQNGPMSNGRNNVKQLIFYWFPAFSGMDARRRCCWSSLGSQMPIRARSQDGRSHLGCNMYWMIEGYNWWKALECCVKRGWSRVPDEFRWTFFLCFWCVLMISYAHPLISSRAGAWERFLKLPILTLVIESIH